MADEITIGRLCLPVLDKLPMHVYGLGDYLQIILDSDRIPDIPDTTVSLTALPRGLARYDND